jgi:hypothetical protein
MDFQQPRFVREARRTFAVCVLAWFSAAQASTLYVHDGATDPLSEGWSGSIGTGGGTSATAVYNDAGSGFDAWAVDDNSTASDTLRYYYEDLTAAQTEEGASAGWSLSLRLRIVNIPDGFTTVGGFGVASTIAATYRDGVRDWYLGFGAQADGDPVIRLPNNNTGTWAFEGGGSGYHLYELRYDPLAGSADFFIDGIERISNIVANTSVYSGRRVLWGATTSPDAGEGRFSSVRFEMAPAAAVPIPAAAWLLGSALGGLAWLRRRASR